jgi:flagellar basal body rod protein FlgG
MLGPTFSALNGLNNASRRLQNSANNLANVQTAGFKKGEVTSVQSNSGGTRVNSVAKLNTQGGLIPTNNPLDLAIEGNEFFQVTNPNQGPFGSVLSGFHEGSNVDIAEEMVDQILAKEAFKANINVIKADDEMIGSLLDIKS